MDRIECQDCGISWKEEVSIYQTFLDKGMPPEVAEWHASCYGATEENGLAFGKNVMNVDHSHGGASHTLCVCGARRGRWSGKLLGDGEEESIREAF